MDTKDTAATTAPSVAPAKPAPAPNSAAEPEPEGPLPSVPLSGLGDDSLEGLRAAFSGLSVEGPEGKKKEKEKEATSSPTTTAPMAEGLGLTCMPYPTYGLTPAATVPPMATAVSEPVASSPTYTGVPEPMLRCYEDGYHNPRRPCA